MDRVAELVAEIRAYCAAHANPAKAGKWARYFSEGYDAWGLLEKDDPFFTEKQAEWLERYAKLGLRGFLKAGALLFESGKYEEGAMAIRFLAAHRDELDAKSLPLLATWFRGIRNWAHTDVLCGEVISPALQAGRITLDDLAPWRESDRKYQRRAVPVAMLSLVKADAAAGPLLDFVRPLMLDSERVVHQGLGWFLRELWKKRPQAVEPFLFEWKDRAARLIYQYATEKMPKEARVRYRRAKAAGK